MGQLCCAESVPHQAGIHVEVESFGERVVRSNTEVTCSQLETATSRDSPPSPASPATSRGETGRQTSQGSIPTLQSKPTMLADDQVSDISEAELLRRTSANPFAGHVAFEGPFCAEDAHRAGFFSILKPPDEGEEVVCFQRNHWLKRGIVEDVDFQVSTGEDGLMKGVEGAWVKVKQQDGSIFHSWAAFLSTSSDHEYSSLCLQAEYEASNFYALRKEMYGSTVTHETRVTKAQARASLESWLAQMIDADGEAVEISPEMAKELLDIFDVQQDASLHLYSLHKRLGPRTDVRKGRDYSLYYQALNNTLNHDTEASLRAALPLIRRMTYLLLYEESTGTQRLHKGGTVWKGDSERPVPLNMQRLKLALRHDVPIRFRQFQSTTSDYKVAARFQKREDHPGFLWVIDIPENHFGARNIQDVSSRSNESETLFPPYSMFQVVEVSNQRCHLKALPWVWEEYEPRSAQGEPFDLDDEPITGCVRCCV